MTVRDGTVRRRYTTTIYDDNGTRHDTPPTAVTAATNSTAAPAVTDEKTPEEMERMNEKHESTLVGRNHKILFAHLIVIPRF
jgi:hypothetical protein